VADAELDLSTPRRLHLVGVGGAGMSAIATVLLAMGHEVSGSDAVDSVPLRRLRDLGVRVTIGHDAAAVAGPLDAVAASTAVDPSNPELVAARAAGVPTLRRADVLSAICATRPPIVVAGTHGKTTTTAMLAVVLAAAGLEPSYVVGGEVPDLGGGAAWTGGPRFVVEGDESDGTFLELHTEVAVLTNVEPDHLEHYGGEEGLRAAFRAFLEAADRRVVCADDPGAVAAAAGLDAVTYGTAEGATYRLADVRPGRAGVDLTVVRAGEVLGPLHVGVPGLHNARNAGAALATAVEAGVAFDVAAGALARFRGVGRRFEVRGEAAGVTVVDDYAHLPTEVAAALAAARSGGWHRVVAVFQPHRYSRTEALARSFADAFVDADLLVVTDVYAAGEAPRPGVTGKVVVDAVLDAHPYAAVAWIPRRDDLVPYLRSRLRPGDVCCTLGAGDLTTLPDDLLAALAGGAGAGVA
jgi:UDP-N-acetylmuramate--alanine ligase